MKYHKMGNALPTALTPPEQSYTVGSKAEVASDEDGFHGSFYEAMVIDPPNDFTQRKNPYGFWVQYDKLIDDQDPPKPLIELVPTQLLRPAPPRPFDAWEEGLHSFELYDVVDAFHLDGWWTGVVTGVIDGDGGAVGFLVTFEKPPEEIVFGRSQLRPHLDWVDGRWVKPQKREIVAVASTGENQAITTSNDSTGPSGMTNQVGKSRAEKDCRENTLSPSTKKMRLTSPCSARYSKKSKRQNVEEAQSPAARGEVKISQTDEDGEAAKMTPLRKKMRLTPPCSATSSKKSKRGNDVEAQPSAARSKVKSMSGTEEDSNAKKMTPSKKKTSSQKSKTKNVVEAQSSAARCKVKSISKRTSGIEVPPGSIASDLQEVGETGSATELMVNEEHLIRSSVPENNVVLAVPVPVNISKDVMEKKHCKRSPVKTSHASSTDVERNAVGVFVEQIVGDECVIDHDDSTPLVEMIGLQTKDLRHRLTKYEDKQIKNQVEHMKASNKINAVKGFPPKRSARGRKSRRRRLEKDFALVEGETHNRATGDVRENAVAESSRKVAGLLDIVGVNASAGKASEIYEMACGSVDEGISFGIPISSKYISQSLIMWQQEPQFVPQPNLLVDVHGKSIAELSSRSSNKQDYGIFSAAVVPVDENARCKNQVFPSTELSLLWNVIEQAEIFMKMPQKPHFRPLEEYEEHLREELALVNMVRFAYAAERISKLSVDDPQLGTIIDHSLKTFDGLENHGFDVTVFRVHMNKLRAKKEREVQLLSKFDEIKAKIEKCNLEKQEAQEMIDSTQKKVKDLEEKLASAKVVKDMNDHVMTALEIEEAIVRNEIHNARLGVLQQQLQLHK